LGQLHFLFSHRISIEYKHSALLELEEKADAEKEAKTEHLIEALGANEETRDRKP
jgi:hypothetical protein